MVLVDELLSGAGADCSGSSVVLVHVVDRRLDTADRCSAGSVEFLDGHLYTVLVGSTIGGRAAGHREDTTQVDNPGFCFASNANAGDQCTNKNNGKYSSHVFSSLDADV